MASVESLEIQVDVNQAITSLQRFQQRMNSVPKSVTKLERSVNVLKRSMGGLGKVMTAPIRGITSLRGALLGLAGAFALKEFVSFGANFGREMSKLQALTAASGKEFLAAKAAIRETGRETAYTATQAAQAANVMASMGKSAKAISVELGTVVKAAGATNTSIDMMAESMASAQNTFGVTAKTASNVFAAAFVKSRANVERLSHALRQVGAVAATSGISLETTAGAAAFLMDRGREAGQAGTDLRNIMLKLVKPSKQAGDSFATIGLEFHKFARLPLNEKLMQLAQGLKTVDQTKGDEIVARIFGAEAVAGAKLMIREYQRGNDVLVKQTELLKSATSATDLYDQMTNNLAGDLDKLASMIQDKVLSVFKVFEQSFRDLTQSTTGFIQSLNPTQLARNILIAAKFILTFVRQTMEGMEAVRSSIAGVGRMFAIIGGVVKMSQATFSEVADALTTAFSVATNKVSAFFKTMTAAILEDINAVAEALKSGTGGMIDLTMGGTVQGLRDSARSDSEAARQAQAGYKARQKGRVALRDEGYNQAFNPEESALGIMLRSGAESIRIGEEYIAMMIDGIKDIAEEEKQGAIELQKQKDLAEANANAVQKQVEQEEIKFRLTKETTRAIEAAQMSAQYQIQLARDLGQIQTNSLLTETEKTKAQAQATAFMTYQMKTQEALIKAGIDDYSQRVNLSDEQRDALEKTFGIEKEKLRVAKETADIQKQVTDELKKQQAETNILTTLGGGALGGEILKDLTGQRKFGATTVMQGAQQLGSAIDSQGLVQGMAQGAAMGGPMGALVNAILQLITELEIFKELMNVLGYIVKIIDAVLRPITDMLKSFMKVLDGLVGAIDILMSVFDPLTETFDELMEMFGDLLRTFAVVLKPLFAMLFPLIDPLIKMMQFLMSLLGASMDAMGGGVLSDEARIEQLEAGVVALEGLGDILRDADQAIKNIEQTVRALTYGDLSILSGQEKLLKAQEDYNKFFNKALSGEADDIQEFTAFVQTYLQIAQGVEKSSKAYQTRYEQVISDLNTLEGSANQRATDAFASTNEKLEELNINTLSWGDSIESTTESVKGSIKTLNEEIEYLSQDGQQNQTQSGGGIDLTSMLSGLAQSIIDAIVAALAGIADGAGQIVTGIVDALAEGLGKVGDLGLQLINGIMGAIADVSVNAGQFLLGILQPIFKVGVNAMSFIQGLLFPITTIASKFKVADFITGLFKPVADIGSKFKVSDLIGGIFGPFEDLVGKLSDLTDGIFKPFETLTDGVGKLFDAVIKALGFDKVKDFLGTLVNRLMSALGLGTMDKKITILPGSLLGQREDLLAIHFKWGREDGGYLDFDGKNNAAIQLDQFGMGGMAHGPSHQSGMLGLTKKGTPFLFEGGEYIINKKSAQKLGKSKLDRLNSYGSGGSVHIPNESTPMHMAYSDANFGFNATTRIPDAVHRLVGGSRKVGMDGGLRTTLGHAIPALFNGDFGAIFRMLQAYMGIYGGPLGEKTVKLPNYGDGGNVHVHVNNAEKFLGFQGSIAGQNMRLGAKLVLPEIWKSGAVMDLNADDEEYEGEGFLQKLMQSISYFFDNIDQFGYQALYMLNPSNWGSLLEGWGKAAFWGLYTLSGGAFNPFGKIWEDGKGGFAGGEIPSYGNGGMVYPFPSFFNEFFGNSDLAKAIDRNKDLSPYFKNFTFDNIVGGGMEHLSNIGKGAYKFFENNDLTRAIDRNKDISPYFKNLTFGNIVGGGLQHIMRFVSGAFQGMNESDEFFPRVVYRALMQGDDFNIEQMIRDAGSFSMGLLEGIAEGKLDPRDYIGLGARKVAYDHYRNYAHRGKPIDSRTKKVLMKAGADPLSVNRARIAFGVPTPGREYKMLFGKGHPGAVTLDNFIGFREQPSYGLKFQTGYLPFLELLAHELGHVKQYTDSGGGSAKNRIYNFIPKYSRNIRHYESDANNYRDNVISKVPKKPMFQYGSGGSVGGYPFPAQTASQVPFSYMQSGSGYMEGDPITASLLEQMNSSLANATVTTGDYTAQMMGASYMMEEVQMQLTGLNVNFLALLDSLTGEENGLIPKFTNLVFNEETGILAGIQAFAGTIATSMNSGFTALASGMEKLAEGLKEVGKGTTGGILSGIGNAILNPGKTISNIFSDRRLKTNVRTFASGGSVRDMFSKLTPYKYQYRGDPTTQLGVMAQDMEKSQLGRQFVQNTPMGKMISGDVLGPVLAYGAGGYLNPPSMTYPSFQTGGYTPMIAADNSEIKVLLRQLIMEMRSQSSNTEVNVYTDLNGTIENRLTDFRTEVRERVARGQEQFA